MERIYWDTFLFNMKQAFGFFNSLVLIILIRPFQDPLKKAYRKLLCKKDT